MAEVRTRDEAIASVERAFQAWAQNFTGILIQATAVVNGARAEAEQVLRRCAVRVASIEQALPAADADSRRRLEAELVRARASHERARRAALRIADVEAGVASLNRSHANGDESRAAAARAQLAIMARGIEGYRNGRAGSSVDGDSAGGKTYAASPASGESLASLGLSDVDVTSADLADTPILGEFGRGGASRSDYRWAVQTWSDTVGPGVAKGMTRADFAARDARNGSPPLRRTADVYDMFVGDNRIRVTAVPTGHSTSSTVATGFRSRGNLASTRFQGRCRSGILSRPPRSGRGRRNAYL